MTIVDAAVQFMQQSLSQAERLLAVHQLMLNGSITFHELVDMHITHMKRLKEGSDEKYMQLQGLVMHMWGDHKSNRDKNLKDIIHHLLDTNAILTTHEEIDAR